MSENPTVPLEKPVPHHLRTDLLSCPNCHNELKETGTTQLSCPNCAKSYPITDGIPCFAEPDAFYDEYASEHCPFAASPSGVKKAILQVLPFWSYREWKFWRRAIPSCERLLDFGCGRGREIFLERAREVVGYDGSLTFLRDCSRRYALTALGQLPRLPFRSGQFDVVASSHTIGHVPIEHKDTLIAEIARTLKPGGRTAHIIETDSDHRAVLEAKKNPNAYKKQFVDQHGHIGLEPANRVLERFADHGFRLIECSLVDAITPSVLNYRRFFDDPALANLPGLQWPRRFSKWTDRSVAANAAYEVGFGAFHRTIEQWWGKPSHAQFIHVAFKKMRD
jgi:SAM-dependent methyltransferase